MAATRSSDRKAEAVGKSVFTNVRFTADQAAKIDAAWGAQGFNNRSAFLRHAILVATGEPSVSPAMLQTMTDTRMELGAISRNINPLALEMNRRRKAGVAVDPAALVKVEDLNAVRAEVRAVGSALKTVLMKAPKKRKSKA